MTDHELLELVAKAAGIDVEWLLDSENKEYLHNGEDGCVWNPLTDDGDAFRLAVKLRLNIVIKTLPHKVYVEVYDGSVPSVTETLADIRVKETIDENASMRRAIVLAVAKIGKTL